MAASTERACVGFETELPLVALGALDGRAREEVLRHVESCPSCAAELESYGPGVDALLSLLPETEPPPDLTGRVLGQISAAPWAGSDAAVSRHGVKRLRRRRPRIVAAVAAAAVVVGIAAGAIAATRARPAPAPTVAALRAAQPGSGVSGHVVLTAAPARELQMEIDGRAVASPVTCIVVLDDGSRLTVGTFWLHGGYDSWNATLPVPAARVRVVTVEDAHGQTVATARLT